MRNLIISILFFLITSCAHNLSLRTPQNYDPLETCFSAIKAFNIDFFNHPNYRDFKNIDSFNYFNKALKTYSISEERLIHLAKDPDHNGHISIKSIGEVESVIYLEKNNKLPKGTYRGASEIDFFDKSGRPWDVKTPISPSPRDDWNFNIDNVINSLRHQLDQRFVNDKTGLEEDVRIILDLRNTQRDHQNLIYEWINDLSKDEKERILIIR